MALWGLQKYPEVLESTALAMGQVASTQGNKGEAVLSLVLDLCNFGVTGGFVYFYVKAMQYQRRVTV